MNRHNVQTFSQCVTWALDLVAHGFSPSSAVRYVLGTDYRKSLAQPLLEVVERELAQRELEKGLAR